MRTFFLFVFLLLACAHGFSQSKDTIFWNPGRKLVWEDFKGRPDNNTNLLAMTQAGIGYEVGCNNGKLAVKIFCYFNVHKSWAKEKDSAELLRHEQLHFDITELYTRKLRRKVSELDDPCGKNIKELNKIYEDNFNECAKAQDDYDKQSNHSLDKQQQKEWEERISKELKELERFAGSTH